MFTGLIEDLGEIRALRKGTDSVRLTVATAIPMEEIHLGDSIAVNGICLTVISAAGGTFTADVSPETVQCTTLSELATGSIVNLERALRLSDRLGGHIVTGHVDAVATVAERRQDGNAIRLAFRLPPEANRYLVAKGSVAIDGISLTVNTVNDEGFSVAVIPHTLSRTTLMNKGSGDRVNIETDILGKYVERLFGGRSADSPPSPVDFDFLAKHGFL